MNLQMLASLLVVPAAHPLIPPRQPHLEQPPPPQLVPVNTTRQLALVQPGFSQRGKKFELMSLFEMCCDTCWKEFKEEDCSCGPCKHGDAEAPICWCSLSRYDACPGSYQSCTKVVVKSKLGVAVKTRREARALRPRPPPSPPPPPLSEPQHVAASDHERHQAERAAAYAAARAAAGEAGERQEFEREREAAAAARADAARARMGSNHTI